MLSKIALHCYLSIGRTWAGFLLLSKHSWCLSKWWRTWVKQYGGRLQEQQGLGHHPMTSLEYRSLSLDSLSLQYLPFGHNIPAHYNFGLLWWLLLCPKGREERKLLSFCCKFSHNSHRRHDGSSSVPQGSKTADKIGFWKYSHVACGFPMHEHGSL